MVRSSVIAASSTIVKPSRPGSSHREQYCTVKQSAEPFPDSRLVTNSGTGPTVDRQNRLAIGPDSIDTRIVAAVDAWIETTVPEAWRVAALKGRWAIREVRSQGLGARVMSLCE